MLSETIRSLRRQRGLSQEELAEALDVSRQAISKWENGAAVPDLDKLQALASYFGITLDELTGSTPPSPPTPGPVSKVGLIFCLTGGLCLLALSLLMLLRPDDAAQLATSSTVTIDGTGILALLCAAVMVLGLYLVVRKK